jgi:hypothetical protein
MKIIRPIILLCATLLFLLTVAVPPWGVCIHDDDRICAEGRDCCRSHPDEHGEDCDTCSDHTPATSLAQAQDRFDIGAYQLASLLPPAAVAPDGVTASTTPDGSGATAYCPTAPPSALTPLRC